MARKTAKKELLNELKGGIASVRLVGKAIVGKDTFPGAQQKEGKTWKHVRSSFGVASGEGNINYVQIDGGYKTDKPILYLLDTDFKPMQIDWEDRFNEEIIETVSQNRKLTAQIKKDENGKVIKKEFLSEIDLEEYLKENLENGMEVIVQADVEYSEWEEKQYTNYKIRSIYLNEPRKKNGVDIPARPHEATLRQTYLLNDYSLEKGWAKELEKNGSVMVNAFVPEYVSTVNINGEYVEVKETWAFPRRFKVQLPEKISEEKLPKLMALYKKLFFVKKDTVREISLVMKLNEGYEESSGEVEITPEMQELIDCGIMTEEEVMQDITIRGDKVSEVIFVKPGFKKSDGEKGKVLAIDDEKYAPAALIRPDLEEELDDEGEIDLDDEDFDNSGEKEEKASSKKEKVEEEDDDDGDGLDDLFDDEDIFS